MSVIAPRGYRAFFGAASALSTAGAAPPTDASRGKNRTPRSPSPGRSGHAKNRQCFAEAPEKSRPRPDRWWSLVNREFLTAVSGP